MKGTHFEQPAKGGSIRRGIVNPDLQEERDKRNFDPEEIEDFIAVPGAIEYYRSLVDDHKKNPDLKLDPYIFELSRDEQQKK